MCLYNVIMVDLKNNVKCCGYTILSDGTCYIYIVWSNINKKLFYCLFILWNESYVWNGGLGPSCFNARLVIHEFWWTVWCGRVNDRAVGFTKCNFLFFWNFKSDHPSFLMDNFWARWAITWSNSQRSQLEPWNGGPSDCFLSLFLFNNIYAFYVSFSFSLMQQSCHVSPSQPRFLPKMKAQEGEESNRAGMITQTLYTSFTCHRSFTVRAISGNQNAGISTIKIRSKEEKKVHSPLILLFPSFCSWGLSTERWEQGQQVMDGNWRPDHLPQPKVLPTDSCIHSYHVHLLSHLHSCFLFCANIIFANNII